MQPLRGNGNANGQQVAPPTAVTKLNPYTAIYQNQFHGTNAKQWDLVPPDARLQLNQVLKSPQIVHIESDFRRLLDHPSRPRPPIPVAKSGSPAGSGAAAGSAGVAKPNSNAAPASVSMIDPMVPLETANVTRSKSVSAH